LSNTENLRVMFGRRFAGPRGQDGPGAREGLNSPDREADGAIIAELDRDVIVEQLLPRLIARRFTDFEGRDYRVAVVASQQGPDRETLITSGDSWTKQDLESPDFTMELFGPGPPLPRRGVGAGIPPQRGGRGGERGRGGDPRGPLMTFAGQNWQLLVKHRAGSVQTAVTEFRNRNLAISFGVLVVLGISAVAIIISSARARRLGRLQMEFAAGISHELRTPLAVIQSAAHNLRSGVVKDEEGIQEYAAIVSSEARRLTETIEQVMAYTETQSGNKRYMLAAVDAGDIIDIAVGAMTNALREANMTVEKSIDSGLPPVLADASALSRCLQNLLSNSAKYGRHGSRSTVEIHGRHVHQPGSPGKVELSVVDHGPGVPDNEVSSLFEPFHRGSHASTNTPGNGLGLHLVERMMKAQNGSIRYEPAPGGGAKFTLTVQAAAVPV
jgi:signal transduction histidine kinase